MKASIVERRLHNQFVARPRRSTPAELVSWLGAVQAQEYQPAKWGLSLRLQNGNSDAAIERAVNEGHILRTHVMRPTWHFVSRDDLPWLLQLTAPRVHKTMSTYTRHQGLEKSTIVRAVAVFERALAGACHLTRAELRERLADAGSQFSSLQMGLLTMYAELEGVICSGPRRGKQFTYALLSERAPSPRRLERDEALAELSRRFFSSHGPATIRDFVWWSGLTTADAKRGLEIIKARSESADGITYWTAGQVRVAAVRQTRASPSDLRRIPGRISGPRRRAAWPRVFSLGTREHHLSARGHQRRPDSGYLEDEDQGKWCGGGDLPAARAHRGRTARPRRRDGPLRAVPRRISDRHHRARENARSIALHLPAQRSGASEIHRQSHATSVAAACGLPATAFITVNANVRSWPESRTKHCASPTNPPRFAVVAR